MVSVDTIRAYTHTYIPFNFLIKNNWKKWIHKDNSISYFKRKEPLLFWYFPTTGILLIKFSIPKFFYGTNAKPFDLNKANLIIKLVDRKIKVLLPNIEIESLKNWICTEIHTFVNYYVDNEKDKTNYLDCLKKVQYSKLKKHNYNTGIQARNKSYALNIYSKVDEIKFRINSKPWSVSNEDFIILNYARNILRFEFQVKNSYLRYYFKDNRTVKDVLRKQFCENLILDALVKANLNNQILYKDELIKSIKNEFGKIKARNLIEFINDYNEMPSNFINNKYTKKTQYNYLRILREKNINPIYLQAKVNRKIDFYSFNEPNKLDSRFIFLKILMLTYLLKECFNQQKNNYIKYITISSIFIPQVFYFEDGGG